MLSKERIIAALEHREGDRVPIGETGADWEIVETVLGRPTYYRSKWKEWLAEWQGKRDDVVDSYSRDIPELVRKLDWDFISVPPVPARRDHYQMPEMLAEYTWKDEKGRVFQYSPESGGHPLMLEGPEPTLESSDLEAAITIDPSRLEAMKRVVAEIGDTHFVIARVPDGTFPWIETVGMEEFLMRMLTDKDFVARATDYFCRVSLAWIDAVCQLDIDGVMVATDYTDNHGLIMGPGPYREFVLPALVKAVEAVHKHGKYFIKHTDGNTWSILDSFVEIGIDAWQGIQPRIGMDMAELKKRYGGKLCFFGGVNCDTLVAGTPAEVEEETRYAMRHAGPGGGLVLTSGNTLQVGTRYENYLAMRQAAERYGRYPLSNRV